MAPRQRYRVRVDDREFEVDVTPGRDGAPDVAVVDGVALEVTAVGRADARVGLPGEPGQVRVALDGSALPRAASVEGIGAVVEVRDAQTAALADALASAAGAAAAGGTIKAPMPGRVVKVLVAAGERVERGAPVVIVEAMKMENELHAPASGTVSQVHVSAGVTVDAGQALVDIDADAHDDASPA